VASSGDLYIPTEQGTIYSVKAATGHVNWKFTAGSKLLYAPAVANDKVYFTDLDGNLHAINQADGKQAWKVTAGSGAVFPPAVAGGQVYVCSSLFLQAFDAASGTPAWYFSPPNYGIVEATPAAVDGTVVVGCSDNSLYAIKALSSHATRSCKDPAGRRMGIVRPKAPGPRLGSS
jgi:outer membrane protein assembly factor BamB